MKSLVLTFSLVLTAGSAMANTAFSGATASSAVDGSAFVSAKANTFSQPKLTIVGSGNAAVSGYAGRTFTYNKPTTTFPVVKNK